MLIDEINPPHHVIALPDQPNLLWRLDEIERLRGIEQLTGDTAGIASGLRREGKASLSAQHLFIRRAHLLGRPRFQNWVFVVSDSERHLPRTGSIAVERMIGIILDWAAGSRPWAQPIGAGGEPRETARCEIRNFVFCGSLCE